VVHLRAGPQRKFDVLGQVRQGDVLVVVGRTRNGKWLQVSSDGQLAWVLAELVETTATADQIAIVKDMPPTPTPRPTRTPKPTRAPRVPRPILLEPDNRAKFKDRVRFKFSWYRELEPNERVSLYLWASGVGQVSDWWASEADILNGGGAIHVEPDRVVYEINSGVGRFSARVVYWKVAIFYDTPEEKRQVSPWSRHRVIRIR
jgi:hypothetical protein